eukprot:1374211-Amorphochlora_amoeboformis.AAC.3
MAACARRRISVDVSNDLNHVILGFHSRNTGNIGAFKIPDVACRAHPLTCSCVPIDQDVVFQDPRSNLVSCRLVTFWVLVSSMGYDLRAVTCRRSEEISREM